MTKETWATVWTSIEVSSLGNVRLDIKKMQALASKQPPNPKKYDEPTMVKVKTKLGSAGSQARKKPVICLDTNQVFESTVAACKYYKNKFSGTALWNCLQGKRLSVIGLEWAYYTENAPR